MPSIGSLVATTELEAVNAMLSSIGRSPISDLVSATQADVVMAVNILRNTSRDVQALGWRFNTEFGYELAPSDTLAWTGSDGSTATLNIFTPPSNLVRFDISKTASQAAYNRPTTKYLDVVLRKSRAYQTGSPVPENVVVFYDRAKNRDGFDQAEREFLYIDPVWLFEFEYLPETTRAAIYLRAARRFQQQTVGSQELDGYTKTDEFIAFRTLQEDQGEEDDFNIFDSADVRRARGGRPGGPSGENDLRASPGPA